MRIGLIVVVAALAWGRPAAALEKPCPPGKVWDPNQGSCIVKVIKVAPARKYYEAIEHLEGTARNANPARGVALLREACSARYAEACTLLGFLYRSGRAVGAADAKQSVKFYDTACKLDDANGCAGAAEVLSRALAYDKAIPYLETACKMKSGRGCFDLAEKYDYALGVKADGVKAKALYAQAFTLLKADCAKKNGPACYSLGKAYAEGKGTADSWTEAFKAHLAGCQAGSGDACNQVGVFYNSGSGVDKDLGQAQRYWELACEKYDSSIACHDGGLTMANAKKASERSAAENQRLMWLGERACTLDKQNCDLIGYLYGTGDGGTKDDKEATRWYSVGCDNGSAASCSSMAFRSFRGIGMDKDATKAIDYWKKACDLRWEGSCTELGNRYYEGEIVEKDLVKAYEWFYVACLRDHPEGCHSYAWALQKGETPEGKPDAPKALIYYNKACDDLKSAGACVDLGRFLKAGGEGVPADLEAAVTAFDKACQMGQDKGCTDLAELYFRGDGVKRDPLRAGAAYLQSCKLADDKACGYVDSLYEEGKASAKQKEDALGVLDEACADGREAACLTLGGLYGWGGYLTPKNGKRAFALYTDGCKRGSQAACVNLAHCYVNGIGVVPNPAKAKELFTEQCDGGVPAACAWLALRLYEEKSYEQSAPLFRRACDDKDPIGCSMIAFSHYTRRGVPWDVAAARKDWELACQLNEPVSCQNMGFMWEYGVGVGPDLKKAAEFYGKGCTPTSGNACGDLGKMYEHGTGVKKDLARAEAEYTRGCEEAGDPMACRWLADLLTARNSAKQARIAALYQKAFEQATDLADKTAFGKYILGLLYRDGVAVVKNPTRAAELFAAACDGWDPLGCLSAGEMYQGGHGLPADYEAAAVRFDRACAAGLDAGCAGAKAARTHLGGPGSAGGIKKKGACACDGGADPAGLFLVLAALALVVRRRAID
ncbi:MAG TPA: tetratricopeptide repeat protein [Kofleriaceae bacterium]|nr:tetratricopeptide repeat protein [Kofleriaceae bacterium]